MPNGRLCVSRYVYYLLILFYFDLQQYKYQLSKNIVHEIFGDIAVM